MMIITAVRSAVGLSLGGGRGAAMINTLPPSLVILEVWKRRDVDEEERNDEDDMEEE